MRNKRFMSLALSITMVLSLVLFNPISAFADDAKELVILHFNDTHARVKSVEKDGVVTGVGFDRIAQYKQDLLKENPNVLMLDAGDTLHGQPIATLSQGESIVKILNLMGIDAFTPGNHDFNYGFARLQELEKMMNFPIVSANVMDKSGKEVFKPYVIKEMDGFKVGIFGLSTPETSYKTNPKNVETIDFTDTIAAAKKSVEALEKENVDVIIALTHLGLDQGDDTSDKVAEAVDGIDLVIDGHSHTTLEEGRMVKNTLIASTGEYDKAFGIVTLKIANGEVTEKSAKLMAAADTKDIVPHPDVVALLADIDKGLNEILSEKIGTSTVMLDGARENVRTKETNFGQLVADAMLDATGAEVALTNGGGIRASIEAGDITKNHIVTSFPFGNYLVTKEVKGKDIKAALEHGLSKYPEQNGGFPHVAGITFTFNTANPAGSRVSDLMIGGSPVDMEKAYLFVTNDFMAAGGDDYTMLKPYATVNEYAAFDEILVNYIKKMGTISTTLVPRMTVNETAPVTPAPEPMPEPVPVPQDGKVIVPEPMETMNYTVTSEMHMMELAMNHGFAWQHILVLNPEISNPMLKLKAGQVIKLPVH
ncbi:5'-Nucleotidase domain protein precursor [Acetoanaerobium sticklandii]|uniref:5'-Nucleotidase domain protein n=1 Tax=Acetoanaerobium sticklandii (strain ATCC 12662 / DSM 519 / JCM 1433 / CCUG 9281 / NCIMB 10654 / HF) TaxID=499177 RepID=E3PUT1_ACESD|nr:5'-nucleotidase C-terminal domain-containing protein [Acetoanaerobium sticklandii]CBH20411.1 5'-Nucleotidase domain protein precursor [Acetoanaerobium sticklandii]